MCRGAMATDIISSEQELRLLYGETEDLAVRKCLNRLDRHCRDFIAASPFLVLATRDAMGHADASPRGDMPGFVEVIDDTHLLLPDRPGNNRLDSMVNILSHAEVGMLFLIPGIRETLRINGRASITRSEALLEKHAVDGKRPKSALLIEVREAFLHCAKALMRSKLWKPETWPDKSVVASAGRIWADHVESGYDADELDRSLVTNLPKNLY